MNYFNPFISLSNIGSVYRHSHILEYCMFRFYLYHCIIDIFSQHSHHRNHCGVLTLLRYIRKDDHSYVYTGRVSDQTDGYHRICNFHAHSLSF